MLREGNSSEGITIRIVGETYEGKPNEASRRSVAGTSRFSAVGRVMGNFQQRIRYLKRNYEE